MRYNTKGTNNHKPNTNKPNTMKIQIEKQAEVITEKNFFVLNEIIREALKGKDIQAVIDGINKNKEIEGQEDFFIYAGGSHIAVHEIEPNGRKDENRLLFIK